MRYRRHHTQKAPISSEGEYLWLISLSDLMILLFVFFVVLFSLAYKKITAADFQQIATKFSSQQSATPQPLDEIQRRLLEWVIEKKLLESVNVERKEDSLILQIREKLLFNSSDYRIKNDSKEILTGIAEALVKIPAPYRIGIEGHTDDEPLKNTVNVKDNWELSSRRAHSVLNNLHLNEEILKRTVLLAYAEMHPMEPNRDEKGKAIAANQAKNRRVTIRIF